MNSVYAALVGCFAALTATNASAQSPTFGNWTFQQTAGSRGSRFCVLTSRNTNSGIGQNVVVKGALETSNLVVDLYYDRWSFKQGLAVDVMFDFGDNRPKTYRAFADGHILDIEIPEAETEAFLLPLARQPALRVIYPQMKDDTWHVAPGNARAAVLQLLDCFQRK